jgi:hypothetical protein
MYDAIKIRRQPHGEEESLNLRRKPASFFEIIDAAVHFLETGTQSSRGASVDACSERAVSWFQVEESSISRFIGDLPAADPQDKVGGLF